MFKLSNEIIFIMLLTMTFLLIHSFMYRVIDFRLNKNLKMFVAVFVTTVFLILQTSRTYKFYIENIIDK